MTNTVSYSLWKPTYDDGRGPCAGATDEYAKESQQQQQDDDEQLQIHKIT